MNNIPSNKEILQNIDFSTHTLEKAKEDPKIDKTGEKLIEKTEDVIRDLRDLISHKNASDKIQKIVKESTRMYADLTKANDKWFAMKQDFNKLDSDELRRNLNKLQTNLRTLAIELIRSERFRADVYDLFSLLYILFFPDFKQLEQKVEKEISEKLGLGNQQGEQSREMETDMESSTSKEEEKSASATSVSSLAQEVKERIPLGLLGEQFEEQYGLQPRSEMQEPLMASVPPTSTSTSASTSTTTTTTTSTFAPSSTFIAPSTHHFQQLRSRQQDTWEKDPKTGNWIVKQDKYQLKRFQNFSSQEQVVEQFNKIFRNIKEKKDSQEAYKAVLAIYHQLRTVFKDTSKDLSKASAEVQRNPHFKKILELSQELLYSMTNYDLSKFAKQLQKAYFAFTEDAEIESLVNDFSEFIKSMLSNPDEVGSEKSKMQIEELYKRGRKIGKENKQLRSTLTKMENEIYHFFNSITSDTILVDTKEDIKELVSMLMLDKEGKFTIKPEILNQLKMILFVTLIQNLRYPLPEMIVDRGDTLKARLRGVVLAIQELLPDKVKTYNEGSAVFNLKEFENKGELPSLDKAKERISVTLENMNFRIPNAEIDFWRDTFPTFDDSGRVAINMGGRGIDLTLRIRIDTNLESEKVFEMENVECLIHDLDIHLFDTKHDTLYNAVISLLNPLFKSALQNYIEESVEAVFVQINDFIISQRGIIQEGIQRTAQHVFQEITK